MASRIVWEKINNLSQPQKAILLFAKKTVETYCFNGDIKTKLTLICQQP